MKGLREILAAIGLAFLFGCATTAPQNPWAGLSTETEAAAGALDCGSFPMPSGAIEAEIVYDQDGVNALEVYRICSEANQANVDEHAAQIAQLKIARRGLTEAGQAQRNIATMRAEMLEEERRHHLFKSIGYWILIVGSLAV